MNNDQIPLTAEQIHKKGSPGIAVGQRGCSTYTPHHGNPNEPMKTLNLQTDNLTNAPLSVQIGQQIERLVNSGALKPGDQHPTVRQLAEQLDVHFNTVARVYRSLAKSGLISTQRGRGTYILPPASPETAQKNRHQVVLELALNYIEEAIRLGYKNQEIKDAFNTTIKEL